MRRPAWRDPLGWLAMVGTVVLAVALGLSSAAPSARVAIDSSALAPMGAHGWTIDATPWLDTGGLLWTPGAMDSMGAPRAARHRVLVDGSPLAHAHAQHAEIAELGGGRHSFWNGAVYLSTPDGGPPVGRLVELELSLRPRWWVGAAGLLGAVAIVAWLALRCRGRAVARVAAAGAAALPIALLPVAWFDPPRTEFADVAPPVLLLLAIAGAALSWLVNLAITLDRGGVVVRLVGRMHRIFSTVAMRWDGALGRCAAVALLVLSLLRMWAPLPPPAHLGADVSPASIFRGRIVAADALAYWHGAEMFRCAGEMSIFSSRRPMYPALLAAESVVAGGSRPVVMLMNAVISGLALGALAVAVGRCAGTWVGLATFALCLGYAQQFVAYPLTEQLGLVLGALGLTLLLDGTVRDSTGRLAGGTFVFAMAMAARAGALFALPAVVLAALLLFRPRRRALASAAACIAAIGAAWGCNQAIFATAGAPGAAPNANFAHVVLGMAMGGDWTDAERWFMAQPERARIFRDSERADLLYNEAVRRLRRDPAPFFHSLRKSTALFASEWCATAWNRFGWRGMAPTLLPHAALGGAVLAGLGMLALVRQAFRFPRFGVPLLLLFAGTLASMPVVWTDGRWRVLAPTMPVLAVVTTLWLMPPQAWLGRRRIAPTPARACVSAVAGPTLVVATMLLVLTPLAAALVLPVLAAAPADSAALAPSTMVVPTPSRLGSVIVGGRDEFSWFGPVRTDRAGFARELEAWNRGLDPAALLPGGAHGSDDVAVIQAIKVGGHPEVLHTMLLVGDPAAVESNDRFRRWQVSNSGFSDYFGGIGRLEAWRDPAVPAQDAGEPAAVPPQ